MEKKTTNKTKWVHRVLISVLVIAVGILTVALFRTQNRLDTLIYKGRYEGPTHPVSSAAATPQSGKSDKSIAQSDDDPLSTPFDPNTWDPFAELQRMQHHIDRIFSNSLDRFGKSEQLSNVAHDPGLSPKLDVEEKPDEYVITVDLPGVDKGSVDVHVNGREVEISGTKTDIKTEKDKDQHVVLQERSTGSFSRSIALPKPVDASRMVAKNDNGVFTIELPKT
jgi:HSP20 family protein